MAATNPKYEPEKKKELEDLSDWLEEIARSGHVTGRATGLVLQACQLIRTAAKEVETETPRERLASAESEWLRWLGNVDGAKYRLGFK
jgi:hypothetical protein